MHGAGVKRTDGRTDGRTERGRHNRRQARTGNPPLMLLSWAISSAFTRFCIARRMHSRSLELERKILLFRCGSGPLGVLQRAREPASDSSEIGLPVAPSGTCAHLSSPPSISLLLLTAAAAAAASGEVDSFSREIRTLRLALLLVGLVVVDALAR